MVLSGRCSAGLCRECWRSKVFNECFMLNLAPALLAVQRLYILFLLMFRQKVKKRIQIGSVKKRKSSSINPFIKRKKKKRKRCSLNLNFCLPSPKLFVIYDFSPLKKKMFKIASKNISKFLSFFSRGSCCSCTMKSCFIKSVLILSRLMGGTLR